MQILSQHNILSILKIYLCTLWYMIQNLLRKMYIEGAIVSKSHPNIAFSISLVFISVHGQCHCLILKWTDTKIECFPCFEITLSVSLKPIRDSVELSVASRFLIIQDVQLCVHHPLCLLAHRLLTIPLDRDLSSSILLFPLVKII